MTSRPHILYLLPSLNIGGTERHLVTLAQRLVQRDWQVSVYGLGGDGPLRAELQRGGVNVILPPCASASQAAGRIMRLARTARHFLSVLRGLRPEIVHFLLPAAYLFGTPLAVIARVPIRVMTRQSLNLYQKNTPGVWIAERFFHTRMQAILAVSRRVLEQLRDEEGVPRSRLGLIYNGIELAPSASSADKDAVRARLGLGAASLVMVMVANLIPYKGHTDLLEALAIARPNLPEGWRVLIVGRDDGIGGELREYSRRLSLNDNVLFLGQRSDVSALLEASDIGILCSHQEGFSIAVLEGMAAGLPMIVTDVGGNAEAIIDGASGLVVRPRDPAGLAGAIGRLAMDFALRTTLGEAARRRVQEEFSIDDCVRRHEKLYRAMLASSDVPVGTILSDASVGPRIGLAN